MPLSPWASDLARSLLAEPLARRWAHTQGVARQARAIAPILGDEADLLEAAAWLHDIGYSPELVVTGFHPLDGARYLRDVVAAHPRLCNLVAHHTFARVEAEMRAIDGAFNAEFPYGPDELVGALTYCDMTTGPDGAPMSIDDRIDEVGRRYGAGHVVSRFMDAAAADIRKVADRVTLSLDQLAGETR